MFVSYTNSASSNSTSQWRVKSWLQNANKKDIYILRKNGYLNTPQIYQEIPNSEFLGHSWGIPFSPAPGPGVTWNESPHLIARFLGNPLQSFPQVALSHDKKKTFPGDLKPWPFLGWWTREPFESKVVGDLQRLGIKKVTAWITCLLTFHYTRCWKVINRDPEKTATGFHPQNYTG